MPGVIRRDHAGVIALLTDGFSMSETGRRFGIAESHVQWIARKYRGDFPGARRPKPVCSLTGRPVTRMRVPAVFENAGLADDYRDLCRDFGMAEGERRCRRLLAEMAPTPSNPPAQGADDAGGR